MIRYNTNTATFEGYSNGSWSNLAGAGFTGSYGSDATFSGAGIPLFRMGHMEPS